MCIRSRTCATTQAHGSMNLLVRTAMHTHFVLIVCTVRTRQHDLHVLLSAFPTVRTSTGEHWLVTRRSSLAHIITSSIRLSWMPPLGLFSQRREYEYPGVGTNVLFVLSIIYSLVSSFTYRVSTQYNIVFPLYVGDMHACMICSSYQLSLPSDNQCVVLKKDYY